VLPLLPALAALMGLALDEAADARWWLAACALLLAAFPIVAPILAAAVANEWSAAPRLAFHWTWLAPAIAAAAVWRLESRGKRLAAAVTIAAGVAAGFSYLKIRCEPEMARIATARALAAEAGRKAGGVCLESARRDWQYGLNYYLGTVLPSCEAKPLPYRVLQTAGSPPELILSSTGAGPAPVDPK
jgi:hypothetical protein